ncbi:hypothetical protein [Brevibacillus sp. MS2.2]|uniref:hypothetical protein n=1 Tax=Brevibacillus sp. MS2.2 TaxID=2738981 RepID=UPI00156B799B|nr:hypothetical protein [Brevibacillus sp. MS2.2]NRR21353.1 hypothetical protein [Brevibacillus sp. MS2.2]
MTAQIAIMNKLAIALATDSAVTLTTSNGEKIYNSANKLFALSKHHPVGIMVYGNAEFMEIPWETLIKVYRSKLKDKQFDTLFEYSTSFIEFLETNCLAYFSEEQQDLYVIRVIDEIFNDISLSIKKEIEKEVERTKAEKNKIINSIIDGFYRKWKAEEFLPNFNHNSSKKVLNDYDDYISRLLEKHFDEIPLNKSCIKKLKMTSSWLMMKFIFNDISTGVVFAGFGSNELFPAICSYNFEGVINNKLKYILHGRKEIDHNYTASILPFAQSEMVYTFIEGIDPDLNLAFNDRLEQIFDFYPEIIIGELLDDIDERIKGTLKENLIEASRSIYTSYLQHMRQFQRENYIDPILDIVEKLPLEELGNMAESLINLTSFKRRMTRDAETVGGPIDVAIISKGDGFIWLKRKHYFQSELNQHYFRNLD